MNIGKAIVAVTLGLALWAGGCAGGPGRPDLAAGEDPLGYYEVRQEDGIYVLGSLAAAEQARAGKLPPRTIRRLNTGGVPVFFEVNNAGLEQRLIADYGRRHGLSE